jgi:hypothetical protein
MSLIEPKVVVKGGAGMPLKEYEVFVNGHPMTLQLNDDDAVRWGVKEPPPREPKRPIGAQTKTVTRE